MAFEVHRTTTCVSLSAVGRALSPNVTVRDAIRGQSILDGVPYGELDGLDTAGTNRGLPVTSPTLRSFAINCLRAAGHHNIAAGLREMSYEPFPRPLALLGLR
jgi:hypothetical protein